MDHFAGLDVSVKDTSVCIVDDTGRIVREVKVASEPDALLAVLKNPAYHLKRIGLEAGPLSQWLFIALAEADMQVVAPSNCRGAKTRSRPEAVLPSLAPPCFRALPATSVSSSPTKPRSGPKLSSSRASSRADGKLSELFRNVRF